METDRKGKQAWRVRDREKKNMQRDRDRERHADRETQRGEVESGEVGTEKSLMG